MQSAKELLYRKSLNKIIVYLRNNIDNIAKINATTIARNTNLSVPSVIRFFQANGFENFADFKFRYLATQSSNAPFENDENNIYSETISSNIKKLFALNDESTFRGVATLITSLKQVTIVGSGSSYGVAIDLNQKLMELGIDSVAVPGEPRNLTRITNGQQDHVLIIVSYSMKHKPYIELLENAKLHGSKIILIHGNHVKKFSDRADFELLVNQDDTNNLIVLYSNIEMMLVNFVIAHEIFEHNVEKYRKILETNKPI